MTPPTSPLPVSVCMMCLNEEAHLPAALAQVGEFAEWIVLDTGSSDATPELAARLGATVRHATWAGFSETRRLHFGMATQPWILWIDADEVVTPEMVAELRRLLDGGRAAHAAYQLNRVMYFEKTWIRHGDWFPDRVLRLFRADCWSLRERCVHESVEIKGSIGKLDSELPHYSYRDWRDRSERIARYAKLWAKQEAAKGRKSSCQEAAVRAAWRFLRAYLVKGGVFGGVLGLRVAGSCAKETWLKYAELAPAVHMVRAFTGARQTPTS